jgi:hypothetical protein
MEDAKLAASTDGLIRDMKTRKAKPHIGPGRKSERERKKSKHMARKGNPISVRLDLNRSSEESWFSEGDRESHRMAQSFPFSLLSLKALERSPERTRLEGYRPRPEHVVKEAHWACFDRVSGAQCNVDIMNAGCWIPGL